MMPGLKSTQQLERDAGFIVHTARQHVTRRRQKTPAEPRLIDASLLAP